MEFVAEDIQLRMLKRLVNQQSQIVKPVVNTDSFCGYSFPDIQDQLGVPPGDEIVVLNHLSSLGLFDRILEGTIHLCPQCHNCALHFQEACPQCQESQLVSVEMLHHFACGLVAPQEEFGIGPQKICPKCQKALQYLGVDHERPASSYQCQSCQTVCADPVVVCRSLVCGKTFPVEQAIDYHLYAYRLKEQAAVVVAKNSLAVAQVPTTFLDADYQIYTSHYFEEELSREVHRATRTERPFCVLMIRPEKILPFEQRHGNQGVLSLGKTIAELTRQSVRASDVVSRYQDQHLALMFPETPMDGANIAASRLRHKVQQFTQDSYGIPVDLGIGIVEFPGPSTSSSEIIQTALTRLTDSTETEESTT